MKRWISRIRLRRFWASTVARSALYSWVGPVAALDCSRVFLRILILSRVSLEPSAGKQSTADRAADNRILRTALLASMHPSGLLRARARKLAGRGRYSPSPEAF